MRVRGIHHVNVNVHALDESLDFYVNKLGFQPFERPEMKIRGGWLRMGAQEQHFALLVDDVDEAATHLESTGVPFRRIHNDDGRSDQLFIHDPSGNRIEIQGPA
jgi:catechol 2,3-dioxygenase-like lactoylglutathione lyase family enzyme